MRKRSLKRIPQDILPWARLNKVEEGSINIYTKKNTHWESGNRRKLQTTILNKTVLTTLPSNIINYNIKDFRTAMLHEDGIFQINYKFFKKSYSSKLKNFCLFLGHGRTYNRKLHISRQAVRKLMKTGLISGLQK